MQLITVLTADICWDAPPKLIVGELVDEVALESGVVTTTVLVALVVVVAFVVLVVLAIAPVSAFAFGVC